MGFTETWSAVKEEGVITVTWGVDDTAGSRDGEVVIGTDDEVIESVFLVKAGLLVAGLFGGGRAFDGV